MKLTNAIMRAACALTGMLACLPGIADPPASALPSETPAAFKLKQDSFNCQRRTVEIAMRDGVHLHTVILVPQCAHSRPILLTRTPYKADDLTNTHPSGNLASILQGYDNAADVIAEEDYIRVIQDVRGKYKSYAAYLSRSAVDE